MAEVGEDGEEEILPRPVQVGLLQCVLGGVGERKGNDRLGDQAVPELPGKVHCMVETHQYSDEEMSFRQRQGAGKFHPVGVDNNVLFSLYLSCRTDLEVRKCVRSGHLATPDDDGV